MLVLSATGFGTALLSGSDGGDGVVGTSVGGNGVYGLAVHGSGSGVFGENREEGNGVYGVANNTGASGVYGQNDSTGFGEAGRAPDGTGVLGDAANGIGVWASSQNGTALHVSGKAQFTGATRFSRSGILTVAPGESSATQTGVALTSTSLVLTTLQQDRAGVWVRSAVPTVKANSFTVHLSKEVTAKTKVAWFVVN